ncbi:MAG: hypothetical protein ACXWDO_01920 [Bacteroidia bacterium]
MRSKILFCFLLTFACSLLSLTPDNKTLTLENAIKNGSISCTYIANSKSPHYVKPLLLTVKNRKHTPTVFKIEPGQQFFPQDESYQNLIVTRENLVTLKPNEQKTVEIYAMCTEANDAAPGSETTYKLAPYAKEKLMKTAQHIARTKSNNVTGQNAIWVISNNRSLEEIIGPDTAETRNLQRFLAKLTGKKLPPPPSANNYITNYYAPPRAEVSYTGNFTMSMYQQVSLTIALFNREGVVVRELYNNPAVPKGVHTFKYAFDNSVFNDDFYWVRTIVNGDIKFNRKIAMN